MLVRKKQTIYKLGDKYIMASPLELIVREAKVEFAIAKHDGVLEVSEIISIALLVAKKVYALTDLSEAEKDAMVVLALKKGLAVAGGLDGLPAFSAIPAAAREAVEDQLLKAGLSAVQAMRAAAPALFAPLKKVVRSCLPYCSAVQAAAAAVDPKAAALIQEALKLVGNTEESSQESVVVTVVDAPKEEVKEPVNEPVTEPVKEPVKEPVTEPVVENTPLPNTPEVVPNHVAFA